VWCGRRHKWLSNYCYLMAEKRQQNVMLEDPGQVSPAGFTYCEISFYVYVFFLCVGAFLCSCGLLICIFSVWVAIKDRFPNSHKCVYYTIASIVAVFVTVLVTCIFVSLIGTVFVIPTAIFFVSYHFFNQCLSM